MRQSNIFILAYLCRSVQVYFMAEFMLHSPSEQVAAHLRDQLLQGLWSGQMPGTPLLAAELGVDRRIITAAMSLLERDGLIVRQGAGRACRIVAATGGREDPAAMRIAILAYDQANLKKDYIGHIQNKLEMAGHTVIIAQKSLMELDMKVSRIRKVVADIEADAWVVVAGSHEVLEWFATRQPKPVMALFGRMKSLPIASAGTDKTEAQRAAIKRLVGLGHHRIVKLVREERRKPNLGSLEQAYLNELAAQGITTGPFNLPDWENNPEGFHRCLDTLFSHTPPTAIFMDELPLYTATMHFLTSRGLRVPEDVSLVSFRDHPSFEWCRPSVAHIAWDNRPLVRHILHWITNLSQGRDDKLQKLIKAKFIDGGTVGESSEITS